MWRKRRARWARERKMRGAAVWGGYTTDKRVDVSKLRFPDPKPASPVERTGKDSKSD